MCALIIPSVTIEISSLFMNDAYFIYLPGTLWKMSEVIYIALKAVNT